VAISTALAAARAGHGSARRGRRLPRRPREEAVQIDSFFRRRAWCRRARSAPPPLARTGKLRRALPARADTTVWGNTLVASQAPSGSLSWARSGSGLRQRGLGHDRIHCMVKARLTAPVAPALALAQAIPAGRCAWWSAFRRARTDVVARILAPKLSECARPAAGDRTSPAPPAPRPRRWWRSRRPTATRS